MLVNKTENNSSSEGAFYQSELIEITQIVLFSFSHFVCVIANASELFCIAHLANIERSLYHSNLSF